jgi:hypothetical protein
VLFFLFLWLSVSSLKTVSFLSEQRADEAFRLGGQLALLNLSPSTIVSNATSGTNEQNLPLELKIIQTQGCDLYFVILLSREKHE